MVVHTCKSAIRVGGSGTVSSRAVLDAQTDLAPKKKDRENDILIKDNLTASVTLYNAPFPLPVIQL